MAFKVAILFAFLAISCSASAQLTTDFYGRNCSMLLDVVEKKVREAIKKDPRMGASLLRLHFHDCFVQGCDASILLDDINSTKIILGEKTARPNNNSAKGFGVVDIIKAAVEKICPKTVSCADILAIAARDSVVILGGETWKVPLGRRDSLNANFTAANTGSIPAPTFNVSALIKSFKDKGLNETDLVLLSGAHTIGVARCTSFRDHIYNDTDIDASFANNAKHNCSSTSGSRDNKLAPLDIQTPTRFDNKYFKNLEKNQGLLHSDQELFSGGNKDTVKLVQNYNSKPKDFMKDFGNSMIKMGNIDLLTGNQGEIRTHCRRRN